MSLNLKANLLVILFVFMFSLVYAGGREVVIYTSVDQTFSEPILELYKQKTNVNVKAVYDVEAAKTTGLVNRLIAERKRPKADVFWNSEMGKTIVLKKKGILLPYKSPSAADLPAKFIDQKNYWTGFAVRARILVYNTKLLREDELPNSIFELTEKKWQAKVAMAYPLFGTTLTHMAALRCNPGPERAQAYLKALKANDVVIVDGNSVVRDLVVEGKLPIGFTDTDDVNVAIQAGKPVKMIYPDKDGIGTLLIPNTVALIKGAPHPVEGKKLIDYLLSREVESKLSFSESANLPLRDGVKTPAHVPAYSSITAMDVDFYKVAENMEAAARFCQKLFVR